ncbi:FAD/NAD(P)-binding domain-containing protein [Parathielavia hyrcaniae]|uniref:FAD/NAD(P)-binding domain-containing protein n=1 Tax=Parathielavia hyrcaniae TaxID=113614 RepID=A0AAN6Q3Q3_9PEZI|nr:FAD/NAD(P)-binding domain-containing protein [Parathielavia hyrcaniae]
MVLVLAAFFLLPVLLVAVRDDKTIPSKPLIEPLPDFDWKSTPPMKLRPFKPTYNITMAIQCSTPSDLIVMDSNYLPRVTARRQLIAQHPSSVLGTCTTRKSSGDAAVRELYTYLLGTYLPTRYPAMFELVQLQAPGPSASGNYHQNMNLQNVTSMLFRNKVTGLESPIYPLPSSLGPDEMLRIVGETVEDDMFLLLRDRDTDDSSDGMGSGGGGGEHRAVAFVCCNPAGFDPAEKLGKRLVDIHGPVPAYEKIGPSMERYFGRLEVGKVVKRVNWTVQTHSRTYTPRGHLVHVGETAEEETSINVEEARVRVELQSLTRLPQTKAALFSFKTYMYPLAEMKAEGLGPQLADAIEGLKAGNAPGMWVYKGGVRWGRVACDMAGTLRNVVVVGGSYVGLPRFAITSGHEHKAFIPFTSLFSNTPIGPPRHQVARARAVSLQPHTLTLDREWQGTKTIPFDYLIVATGTRLAAPGTMPGDDKPPSVRYLQGHQARVRSARSVAIVGGGAVGVQMACDLKEAYPSKTVTLVHSRDRLLPAYHEALSNLVRARFRELGVQLVTGSRVVVPPGGFQDIDDSDNGNGQASTTLHLQDGRTLSAEMVIQATGQTPNNQFLLGLSSADNTGMEPSSAVVVNARNGFVHVRPTMQFADARYPHLFAVGDIADSGAHKAARPGMAQAAVAARNVASLIRGEEPGEKVAVAPAGIHLTLGLTRNVIFRNPNTAAGETEPFINLKDDGREDMGIDGVWVRRGVVVTSPQDYHL